VSGSAPGRRAREGARLRRQRFAGQVVFITGASSGIGEALAREFARAGADLALAARRVDRLERLAADLRELGRRALVLPCDVTAAGDLDRAAARARETLGRIDVVVANAGFGVMGPLETLTLDDYRRQFETNVFGVLRTVYATLDDVTRARGRLVLLGSVSGHLALPGASAYAMSKFAVRGLAEALAHELAPRGVAVTLVSPGLVESEMRHVDNRGRWHAEAAGGAPKRLIVPVATAARHIVRAVARRRREAVITRHGKLAVFLQRHAPWLVRKVVGRLGVRSRRQPGRAAAPP
jgi:short-subunit dehydrogenase